MQVALHMLNAAADLFRESSNLSQQKEKQPNQEVKQNVVVTGEDAANEGSPTIATHWALG